VKIGCIVEGHGEEQAVPLLLRRIVTAWVDPPVSVSIPITLRVQRDRLKRPGELERALELIARRLAGDGGILVLIDAEEDPACQLGPALLGRARAAHGHLPTAVVLATRQFEAWFAAAAESLAGHRDLPSDLKAPHDPEARSAKKWLKEHLPRPYSEVLDQPALTAIFDIETARRARSFEKLRRDVLRLVREVQALEARS
jgi:hypothetical protein